MSYQVLARKYRPKSFATLVGQEHVVRALSHALDHKRLHHAYLFTGTRGVGKTTLSRILAKSFNCIGADGNGDITSQPCGVCEACIAIDAGRFVDYIEMDAASNRGVEEMAQLLEQAVYAPSNARFKVYMIDEVHMLTNHAFNSMLKTLEEPPEHVKFILATTDPQKIPVTVLSRCLQFNLKQMPPGHIVAHLDDILGQEGIGFETPALRLLAQGAHGSMRDALSLTDQAIAYAAGTVTLEAVQGMLGALDQSYLIRMMDCLAQKEGAGLLAVADEMAARSLSYSAALQDLASLLHQIALAQTVPAALAEDLPEREDIIRLAAAFDAEEIQLFYQIAVHGRNEMGLAPDEYAGFSMTLLRMLAFRPVVGSADDAPPVPTSRPAPAAAPRATATATVQPALPATQSSAPVQVPMPSASINRGRAALDAARGITRAPVATIASTPVTTAAPMASIPANATVVPTDPSKSAAAAQSSPPWDQEWPPASMDMPDRMTESYPPENYASAPAVARSESAQVPKPKQVAEAPRPLILHPIAELNWNGNWPLLAATLPVRGVAQQLAQQSELIRCQSTDNHIEMHLRVAVETLLSSGSLDKLAVVLTEHFGKSVRMSSELGAVQQTANAHLIAERAERQRQAEDTMQSDPFVLTLMREFGATIVPGSIKPIPSN
ncbi:MAG: DNA polymerase III subunit gamma/tau [Herminiimonas sp.]|nr:DNA polymerase III subunit gamma/tau [Herminiimonas sp.]